MDDLGAATAARTSLRIEFGSHEPLKAHRVRFSGVAPVDQDEVGVFYVTPMVGHGPSSERGGQTDHRGAVSDPGLLLQVDETEAAQHFGGEIALFVAKRGAAGERDALATVDGIAFAIRGDERAIARCLDVLR